MGVSLRANRATPSFSSGNPLVNPMSSLRFPLAVIMQRTPVVNRWIEERWEPVAIVEDVQPSRVQPVKESDDEAGTRWYFGGLSCELHPSEAEGYYLNITSPEPKVFVMWRTAEEGTDPVAFPVIVTVSYNQAARMLDGGEQVDAVPMPREILAWMKPFVAEHYKPEIRKKVRRNDPFRDGEERRDNATRSR
jgi:hypothetical protein